MWVRWDARKLFRFEHELEIEPSMGELSPGRIWRVSSRVKGFRGLNLGFFFRAGFRGFLWVFRGVNSVGLQPIGRDFQEALQGF